MGATVTPHAQVCTSLATVAADSILQGRERRESQEYIAHILSQPGVPFGVVYAL